MSMLCIFCIICQTKISKCVMWEGWIGLLTCILMLRYVQDYLYEIHFLASVQAARLPSGLDWKKGFSLRQQYLHLGVQMFYVCFLCINNNLLLEINEAERIIQLISHLMSTSE